jgi:hypothetical protein
MMYILYTIYTHCQYIEYYYHDTLIFCPDYASYYQINEYSITLTNRNNRLAITAIKI